MTDTGDPGEEPIGDARRGLANARAALASTGEAPHRPRPTPASASDAAAPTPSAPAPDARVAVLEAENQRLRAALADITDTARSALDRP